MSALWLLKLFHWWSNGRESFTEISWGRLSTREPACTIVLFCSLKFWSWNILNTFWNVVKGIVISSCWLQSSALDTCDSDSSATLWRYIRLVVRVQQLDMYFVTRTFSCQNFPLICSRTIFCKTIFAANYFWAACICYVRLVQVFVDFDLSDQLINFAAPKQKTHTLLCDFISCVFQQWTHMQFLLQLSLGRCRRCSVKRRVMLF